MDTNIDDEYDELAKDFAEAKKYIGCKSWMCKQCKHYQKFLSVSTMQMICWNKGCFYSVT